MKAYTTRKGEEYRVIQELAPHGEGYYFRVEKVEFFTEGKETTYTLINYVDLDGKPIAGRLPYGSNLEDLKDRFKSGMKLMMEAFSKPVIVKRPSYLEELKEKR